MKSALNIVKYMVAICILLNAPLLTYASPSCKESHSCKKRSESCKHGKRGKPGKQGERGKPGTCEKVLAVNLANLQMAAR